MKYIIMCGGIYDFFTTPKQLSVVKGETLVERTIRQLLENNINKNDIYISSNDMRFDNFGVERIENDNNTYEHENTKIGKKAQGYWLDAFYPLKDDNDNYVKVTYLYGDVFYSDIAIKNIVQIKSNLNILFGSKISKNNMHRNWGEPFAFVVNNPNFFHWGISMVKDLQDRGKIKREKAITWELYRFLNGFDINNQYIDDDTFVVIDDYTIDIDNESIIQKLNGLNI